MKIVKNIAFKLINRYFLLKLRYRADFYAFKYRGQTSFAPSVSMGDGTSVFIPYNDKPFVTIKEYTVFRRFCTLTLDAVGQLFIGNNNFFNNNCSVNCLGKITIGDNNLFGENVKLYDHNHVYFDMSKLVREQGFSIGEIVIGDNCWFGTNCVILNNVTIGDNVVVGANNLIYKSIPSNTIVKAAAVYSLKDRT